MKEGTIVSLVTLSGEFLGKWVKEENGNITLNNPRMLVNTPDGKVGFARNNGAKFVETPYILFMDADSVFIGENVLNETLKNLDRYDIISVKQQSTTTNDKKSIWTYKILDWIRKIMPITFCTGCFFLISKKKFDELGGFDETLQNSEDFWLSKQIPTSKFKILNEYI